MKVFISADIEGVTGCTTWDETEKDKSSYQAYARQMTREVEGACIGANEAGAKEIIIKDAHDSGRNIDHSVLPLNTKLVRSWAGGLYSMVQELDSTFSALIYIGYHSAAGTDTNPLSHTMNTMLDKILINGRVASEFLIHSYIAAYHNVPIVFLSGDKGLCKEAESVVPGIKTVAVKEGRGNSTINIHPELAIDMIKEGVKEALTGDLTRYKLQLPEEFNVSIRYKNHKDAYSKSHYPGVERIDEHTICFNSKDYIEVLRLFNYVV